jgi:hypothetical protein
MLNKLLPLSVIKKYKPLISNKWAHLTVVCVLAILLRFYPFLLGKTLIFGDNYSLMVPGKVFTAQWLKQGILPLWNSNIFAGLPWISDINQSVLYPSTLLFLVFHPATALNITLVLHLILTFIGMYIFLRFIKVSHFSSLIGALLWMLSTQVAGSLHNLSTIQSIAWFPWITWVGLQVAYGWRYKLSFALFVLMQFLGGYPQHVLYSIVLAVITSFIFNDHFFVRFNKNNKNFQIWLWNWIQTAALTVSLSAVAWLPFLELLLNSTRMQQTLDQASVGSLNPIMLVKMIIPYFFDKQIAGYKWGPAWSGQPNVLFYFTWFGVLMLLVTLLKFRNKKNIQKKNKWLILVALGSLIFALGNYLPGFSWLQRIIPLLRIGRYPSMSLVITTIVLIMLISRTLDTSVPSWRQYKKVVLFGFCLSLLNAGLLLVLQHNFAGSWANVDRLLAGRLSLSPFHTLTRDRVIVLNILQNLIISASLFSIAIFAWVKQHKKVLILAIMLDLVYATQGMFIFAPNQVYDVVSFQFELNNKEARLLTRNQNQPYTDYGSYWEALVVRKPFSDSFVDRKELIRFEHPQRLKQGLTPNWNMVHNIPTINGYTTLLPQDYAAMWQKTAMPRINFIDHIDLESAQDLLQQWSVKYYLVDNWFDVKEDLTEFQKIAEKNYWTLYQFPALNRFRFVGETLENQDEPDFQLELENYSETPNKIEFNFTNPTNHQHLIIADRYDPNWIASVNDQTVDIQEFNHMRRIPIKPGFNQVKLTYCPKHFYDGIVISLLALIAGIGGIVVENQSKKPKI